VTPDADLAIVGSGFGGTILAMIAARLGRRVVILERGSHPRFAIGESASPLAGLLLETLAERYDLPRLSPLASFGHWQRSYPSLTCGMKRGFTFFKHAAHVPYRATPERSSELMVAASPDDELADTHWLRADVDQFLVHEAAALGVDYVDRVTLDGLSWDGGDRAVLTGSRLDRPVRVTAGAVVDASGPHGFLVRALGIGSRGFERYPGTQALYSHFTGVARCADLPEYGARDGARDGAPYPVDAAALHHVFDGGWMWVLRFGNGVTSAGVAVTDALAADLRLADGHPAWARLLARYPSIGIQFAAADAVRAFTYVPKLSFRADVAAGDRWALLPSAAAFVDPLFSTGFPLTLLGIERLARLMEGGALGGRSGAGDSAARARLADYSRTTLADADGTARFVAGSYAGFPRFENFTAYSMFYFATASFSEMARRLGVATPGFLGAGDLELASALARLSPAEGTVEGRAALVGAVTERVNIAGLCDPAKRNWYPADPADTIRGASKLGVTPERVRTMLAEERTKASRRA
jgi:FADH2 O2-dependent halogenase